MEHVNVLEVPFTENVVVCLYCCSNVQVAVRVVVVPIDVDDQVCEQPVLVQETVTFV